MIITVLFLIVMGLASITMSYEDYAVNKNSFVTNLFLGLILLTCATLLIIAGGMDILTIHDGPCHYKRVM